jgi:hypothetical protein
MYVCPKRNNSRKEASNDKKYITYGTALNIESWAGICGNAHVI